MDKFSFVVISYNHSRYLDRCILSCINQTYNNIEIIIGDDYSNDGSIEKIKKYHKNYNNVRYFINPRNNDNLIIPSVRSSAIIKKALQLSTGKYICVISGDDYLCDNNKVKEAVNFLNNNSDYFCFVSSYKTVGDSESEFTLRSNNRHFYWSTMYHHISSFVFRKVNPEELLDRFCDDTGLEYILALKGKWKINSKVTFAYVQHESSIMHSSDKLELNLVELLIFQDIINHQKKNKNFALMFSSLSRFYSPLNYCLKKRHKISEPFYIKYIINAKKYESNILNLIIENDEKYKAKISIFGLLALCMISRLFYKIVYFPIKMVNNDL